MKETAAINSAHDAILKSGLELCRDLGYEKVTLKAVAEHAGVSVDELRKLWKSKSALVIDAFRKQIGADFLLLDSGDFAADLRNQLTAVARVFNDPAIAPHLKALVADVQRDQEVSELFAARVFGPNRYLARMRFEKARECGQIRTDIELDTAIDLTFAPLWFRLLLPAGQLTEDYAVEVVELSLAALSPDR